MGCDNMDEDGYKEAELEESALNFIKMLEDGLSTKESFTDTVSKVRNSLVYKNNSDPILLTGAENLDIIFNGLKLNEAIAFDEFTRKNYQVKPFPWEEKLESKKEFTEEDFINLSYELNRLFEFQRKSLLRDAIQVHARKNKFNIVKEFITKVQWDGTKRVDTFFIDYLGVQDSKYVRAVTNLFFRAAVGRVFQPGIKYDYMIVLIGTQGLYKSSLLQKIAGDWHIPGPQNLNAKIGGEFAISAWIIEIDELVALTNSSIAETKTFISRTYDVFRPAYGKEVVKFDRKCVFVGTTNEYAFLRDKTGNRRFLPILTGEDLVKQTIDKLTPNEISQLWAEAYQLFMQNPKLDLSDEMKVEAERVRENHMYYDPTEGKIEEYLNMPRPVDWDKLTPQERFDKFKLYLALDENDVWEGQLPIEISPIEIFTECLGKIDKPINSQDSKLIGQALLNMGWALGKQKRKRIRHYGQQKLYLKINMNKESHELDYE